MTTKPSRPSSRPTTTSEEATAEPMVADLPGFSSPRRQPSRDQADPKVTTVTRPPIPTPEEAMAGPAMGESSRLEEQWSDGAIGDERDDLRPPSSTTGPSPASIAEADPAAFEGVLTVGFKFSGVMLHNRLAPGEHNDVWLVSDDEAEAVCGPLSRILARHTPVTGEGSKDLADGLEAGVAMAGYLVTNWQEQIELATLLQQQQQNAGAPGADA